MTRHPLSVRVQCVGMAQVHGLTSLHSMLRERWQETGLVPVAPTLFLQAAQQHFMGRTVGACASVRMVPAVTTSAASAPAAQASPGNTASRVSCSNPCPWVSGPGLSLPLQGPPILGSTPCSHDFWSNFQGKAPKIVPMLVFGFFLQLGGDGGLLRHSRSLRGHEGGRPCSILLCSPYGTQLRTWRVEDTV